jgi:hypothetical protein
MQRPRPGTSGQLVRSRDRRDVQRPLRLALSQMDEVPQELFLFHLPHRLLVSPVSLLQRLRPERASADERREDQPQTGDSGSSARSMRRVDHNTHSPGLPASNGSGRGEAGQNGSISGHARDRCLHRGHRDCSHDRSSERMRLPSVDRLSRPEKSLSLLFNPQILLIRPGCVLNSTASRISKNPRFSGKENVRAHFVVRMILGDQGMLDRLADNRFRGHFQPTW